jgi:ABC-type transporter Mla subunit MlaD
MATTKKPTRTATTRTATAGKTTARKTTARKTTARKPAKSATRPRHSQNTRALERVNKSLDAAAEALKAVSGDAGAGARELRRDLTKMLKDARRDATRMSKSMRKELEQLQRAVTTSRPAKRKPARRAPARAKATTRKKR